MPKTFQPNPLFTTQPESICANRLYVPTPTQENTAVNAAAIFLIGRK
jgi:hypothetical protein